MNFLHDQSDQKSNIFTKFDQNPTHSKRDISCESGTDTHTHTHIERQTDTQIKFVGATVCGHDNI